MSKKLAVVSFFILLLIVFPVIASAQTITTKDSAAPKLKDQVRNFKDQRQEALKIKKETRTNLIQEIKETVQSRKEVAKEAVKTKREDFKAKLQTISNERKKLLVERIDVKLTNVNTEHTNRFTEVLNNLQALLDKVSASTTDTKILADIKIAQAAIDKAVAAVENQAAKTYVITISTEKALRANVGTITSQLRLDLMATHKLVVNAKQAVQKLRENSAIIEKKATSSANL